ncbi:MAG: hypothetical protein ACJATL_000739 [Rickettsiales bacterium]|jgi:hypothetical protein
MTISMYQASIPVFIDNLRNLSEVLKKGADFAATKKIEQSVLLNSRLAPDMLPLVFQVKTACEAAKAVAARLAEIEVPNFEVGEASFDDLQERISQTIEFLKTFKPEQIDGKEDLKISYVQRNKEKNFVGLPYLFGWGLPNLFFHITVAYSILRHNGVEIGKKDFLVK